MVDAVIQGQDGDRRPPATPAVEHRIVPRIVAIARPAPPIPPQRRVSERPKTPAARNKDLKIPQAFSKDPANSNPRWKAARDRIVRVYRSSWLTCLVGPEDFGKSTLACSVLRSICTHASGRYTRVPQLMAQVRLSWQNPPGLTNQDLLDRFRQHEYLVLDDLPPWESPDPGHRVMFDIIEARYCERRPTLLVVNARAIDISRLLGRELSARIECSGGIVSCEWDSFGQATPRGTSPANARALARWSPSRPGRGGGDR